MQPPGTGLTSLTDIHVSGISTHACIEVILICSMKNNEIRYRKIPNISSGLIAIPKHIMESLYFLGLIFGFVLVSPYQDL